MRRTTSVRVCVLVPEYSTAMVPIGLAEILRKTMLLDDATGRGRRLEVQLVACGPRRAVRTAGGLTVICDKTTREVSRCDVAIASSIDPDLDENLERNAAAVTWLRRMYRAGADVMSVCTGAFFLAEAGLLNGRRATTHWAFAELLQARYPEVRVEPQAILVDEGRICTAGGATSFTHLALYLVERALGVELASASARMFLVEANKAPQTAFAMFHTQKEHDDDEIRAAQGIIERDVSATLSVARLARLVALTERTFARRFKLATGNTPYGYVQRVRIESAKRAIERTQKPLKRIASEAGYRDAAAFRRVFRRVTGLSPVAYRRRYAALAEPVAIGTATMLRRRGPSSAA